MRRFILVAAVLVAAIFVATLPLRLESKVGVRNENADIIPQSFAAVASGVSKKVSSFGPAVPDDSTTSKKSADQKAREIPNRTQYREKDENAVPDNDNSLATMSLVPMPEPSLSFAGLNSNDNAAAYGFRLFPPDTIGDVGFEHYVQAVNLLVRVFDKSGTPLTPPFKLSSLFAPLGTVCSTRNDGDPNVLFDPLANRWILSQFCTQAPPFRQMVAVSKTGDPTGEYYIYEFVMPNVRLNDYSKFGVWTDGYYMSTDEFVGNDYAGSGVFAFDRSKLLNGDPSATYIYFDLASSTTLRIGGLLPSDLDGLRPPPSGAPNVFAGYSATEYGDSADAIRLYNIRPDFANPQNSSFSERPESPIPVASFDPTSPAGRDDIAQPVPGERLDSQSDRLMYRVAYRNHGSFESLVFNQTVRVTPSSQVYRAGVRLHELRRNFTGSVFSVNESSTYGSPEISRFMGAAAQDGQGNLAFGYSTSSEQKVPSIAYSGRLVTDDAGSLRGEKTLISGSGVQKAFGFRWGDYSGMSVDPLNDCDFWITNQYYTLESQEESDFGWLTQIGYFRFPECVSQTPMRFAGSVTNATNGQPIGGATVSIEAGYSRTTDMSGAYSNLIVPQPAIYTVTASARGFGSVTRIISADGPGPRTENFALEPVPLFEGAGIQITGESCAPNNTVEPGEVVSVNVTLRNSGSTATTNLSAALSQSGGVINPSESQNYGVIAPGGPDVTRPFSFRVSPNLNCGAPITLTFLLSESGANFGTATVTLQTGRKRIAFAENFDSVASPTLPAGWGTSATGAQLPWTTSVTHVESVPNAAFSPDPFQVGLNELTSPAIAITSTQAELEFRNWYELETTFLRNRLYDGSVLEVKIGDSNWQDIEAAGGSFLSGGYDGVIDSCCSNPLAGRRGWSGRSGPNQVSEFITSKAKLPAAAAGQNVQLRWRVGTDIGTFRTGQFIDNISVTDGFVCSCAAQVRSAPFDFDGDGKTDLSTFRSTDNPDAPDFFVRLSSNAAAANRSWGSVGDRAANSDFDGDGKTDLAIFRPTTGVWFILGSLDNSVTALNFGLPSDLLTPGDFDGDGKSDIAVFRPSDGNWYAVRSSDSQVTIQKFGISEDVPVPSDYDGDQKYDLAVFRPSTGTWYVLESSSGAVRIARFGLAGDRPVAGDFDGDGRSDLTVYRPTSRIWYSLRNSGSFAAVEFGLTDDRPLQADFDGDGVRDIAVYRPSTAAWYYIGSSGGTVSTGFGQIGDIAVPSIFVR